MKTVYGVLWSRDLESAILRELATIYDVPRSTLSDRARGGKTRRQAHEDYQKPTPGMEKALKE